MIRKLSILTHPLSVLITGLFLFTACAFSQTLTITSGQGQVLPPSGPSAVPLTVQLLGANGQPLANQPVSFTLSSPIAGVSAGNILSGGSFVYDPITGAPIPVSYTDSNGNASVQFIGATAPATASFISGVITALAINQSITAIFYETTSAVVSGGGAAVSSQIISPVPGSIGVFSGQSGSTSPMSIQVLVSALFTNGASGNGVPNVAVSISTDAGSSGTISCKEGPFVLTNSGGVATCTPLFGTVGSGTFTINVGNFVAYPNNLFTVTVGPPALIQITSGNNQSGNPGSLLPLPIVAVVTDLGGNVVTGVPMTFTSVTPGGATFTNLRTTTDTAGKVSASVILGNVPGTIQISLGDTQGLIKSPATFTETVNLTITGLQKNSGDGQTAMVNTAFPSPLVTTLTTSNGLSIQGLPVTFAVVSGSGSVSTPNAGTNSAGQASTNVFAGNTPGPLVISATAGGYTVQFNLNVIPPGPTNLTFVNGASGALNYISPGAIITIYGGGLATNVQGVVGSTDVGPHPYTVGGVNVTFGNVPAPIFDLGNINGSQFVTVQVPFTIAPGTTTTTINVAGGGSTSLQSTILPASPGLFEYIAADNAKHLVALRPDGSVVSPNNPAVRGESIRFYATGMGPLTPAVATNGFSPSTSDPAVAYTLIMGVANQGATYTQAIYARGMVGVEEVTFVVPTNAPSGQVQISIGIQAPSGFVYYSQGSVLNVQ